MAAGETIVYPADGTPLVDFNACSASGTQQFKNSLAPSGTYVLDPLLLNLNQSKSNSLSGNSITVTGGVAENVFGAVNTTDAAPITNNQVFIKGGTVGDPLIPGLGYVYGGYSHSGNVTGNSVTISGGSVGGEVFGGRSFSGNALGNSVFINGGTVRGVDGGLSVSGNATGNSVTIKGGTVTSVTGGYTSTSGSALYNSVTISDDASVGNVYGGVSGGLDGINGNAIGNSVFINGGTVKQNVTGGYSNGGNATGNSVTISGGTVGAAGGLNSTVYGGYSENGNATHNTVTISGNPIFNFVDLVGGFAVAGGDEFTGNTLNVWNYSSQGPVAGVQNFQYLNFAFPTTQTGVVLEATNVTLGDGAGRGSTITASTLGGPGPLQPGAVVTLIDGAIAGDLASNQATGQHGATISYNWTLDPAAGLVATLNSVQAAPEAKALSEGYLAGTMLVNQGADLIAGKGMHEAMRSSWKKDGGYGFGAFGAISGGRSKYNTGSHVDMSSLSLLAGLSWGADLAPGRLTLGAFFEYGTGSYDTYNAFATGDSHGKGDTYHLGGGILGRMDFVESGPGNFYTEASFRAGGLHNDYRNSDLRDSMGRKADYDSFSAYYGIHAGVGYIWKFTEQASLDIYGKFFWARQQGDSVRLSTGDPVKFKDVDSLRTRLGARFAYAINDYVASYIGAAWEHEFDGKARATTYGYGIDKPSLFGSTGIGELGLNLKPSKDLPLSFDLGVQGYVGKRQGVTGSLQAKFEF